MPECCSSEEFRLLLAICSLADFGYVANAMEGGTPQGHRPGCDKRHRAAIAARIEAGSIAGGQYRRRIARAEPQSGICTGPDGCLLVDRFKRRNLVNSILCRNRPALSSPLRIR